MEKDLKIKVSCVDINSDQAKARIWLNQLSEDLTTVLGTQTSLETGGIKSSSPLELNTIILSLLASGGLLIELVRLIQARITKEQKVMIEVDGDKLEVVGAKVNSIDHDLLVKEFIKRHTVKTKTKRSKSK